MCVSTACQGLLIIDNLCSFLIQVAPRTALCSAAVRVVVESVTLQLVSAFLTSMHVYFLYVNNQFSVILGEFKQQIINNLREEDNLCREDKKPVPKVSFVRRFNCTLVHTLTKNSFT